MSVNEGRGTLLYIADEDERAAMSTCLAGLGLDVVPTGSQAEVKHALREHPIACAFVEVRSSQGEGITVIELLRSSLVNAPLVVLSSDDDLAARVAARDAGADEFLAVPARTIDAEMRVAALCKRLARDAELEQVVESATVFRTRILAAGREAPTIAGGHPPELDELTGLIGAGGLQDHLDREYARARRYGHALSVLMLEIDDFARYQKHNGEEAAQAALCLVADVLRSALRSPDIAAKVGSDDFVILATDTTEEQAMLLAERLKVALRTEGSYTRQPPITLSVGIAGSGRLDVRRSEDLLVAAQHAAMEARGAGGDCHMIAS